MTSGKGGEQGATPARKEWFKSTDEGKKDLNKRPDRLPTKWVNFVTDEKYAKEETSYKMYVSKPAVFEGRVVHTGRGETKVGRRTFESNIIVIENGNRTRYGFNLPRGSYFYTYLHHGDKVESGDRVKITYLGLAKNFGFYDVVNPNSYLIKIDVVEKGGTSGE